MSILKEVLTKPLKVFYVLLGSFFVVLGIIGLILPLVPGTIFLIIAAAFFARSSKRLETWLLTHPALGHHIEAWRTHRAISKSTKRLIFISLLVSFFILNLTQAVPIYGLIAIGLMFCGIAAFIHTRPHPPEDTPQTVTPPSQILRDS